MLRTETTAAELTARIERAERLVIDAERILEEAVRVWTDAQDVLRNAVEAGREFLVSVEGAPCTQ